MNYDEYKKDRVCDQIDWYNRKSGKNRNVFQTLRTIQIIAGAMIPFLSGAILGIAPEKQMTSTIIVGALGVIVTIATGISTLGRYRKLDRIPENERKPAARNVSLRDRGRSLYR